jgi:N-acetylmuramoyl-L-alanine amidase
VYRLAALALIFLAVAFLAAGPRSRDWREVNALILGTRAISVEHVARLPREDLNAAICTATAIYHEARAEPERGRLAVAVVVRNRVRERGQTACEVVYAQSQFSWSSNPLGWIVPREADAWDRSLREAYRVLVEGEMQGFAANQFVNTNVVIPNWLKGCLARERIGNHLFCRIEPRGWR